MRVTAGVDLGGTKILRLRRTGDGKVLARAKRKTRPERGPHEVLDRLVRTLGEALDEARVPIRRLAGVGVAVPGASA